MALNLHSCLHLDEIQQKDAYLTLTTTTDFYGTNEGKIVLEELHKLWKHHTTHLKEMHQSNEHKDQQVNKKNPTFKIG